MTVDYSDARNSPYKIHPVFKGMELAGLSGVDIAKIAGVTPPTVSKWRRGNARIPDEKLAFLTLLLANQIEELKAACSGREGSDWHQQMCLGLTLALGSLRDQESYNSALAPVAIRDGAKTFHQWWNSGPGYMEAKVNGFAIDMMADDMTFCGK